MSLRPADYARMKLGVHKNWSPVAPAQRVAAAPQKTLPPFAYSRVMPTPRVLGHNDLVGDCVPTGCCQAVQTLLGRAGNFTPLSNDLPLAIYSEVTGYNPAEPNTDQGTDPNAMFDWWKQNAIAGYRLAGATVIDIADYALESAVAENGFVCGVVALSLEQQNQIDWTAAGTPGSWGMHFIVFDQYDGDTGFTKWGSSGWLDGSMFTQGFVQQLYVLELAQA